MPILLSKINIESSARFLDENKTNLYNEVHKNHREEKRRDARVVESGGLENRCAVRYREFESHSLRQNKGEEFSHLS